MRSTLTGFALLVATALGTDAGLAQGDAGQALYETNCTVCHRAEGEGREPYIPALNGNENVGDLYVIVANLHQGGAAMPPFPALSTEDITALANYIRNGWGNSFGPASAEEVATLQAEFDPPLPIRTMWDGVFTQAQADRGKAIFTTPCGICHGTRLNGAPDDNDMRPAPALARIKFLRAWDGRSLGTLYSYTRLTMPQSNPGFMPEEDYLAMVAHMLATSGAPAGAIELPLDLRELGHILIGPQP